MYEMTVRHDGLHKFRVIRGKDPTQVQGKARAQILAWDEQYNRKCTANRARSERVAVQQKRVSGTLEAETLTREYQERITEYRSILTFTSKVNDAISWNDLKDESPFLETPPIQPVLQLPRKPIYLAPELTWLQRILPFIAETRSRKARSDHEEAVTGWSDTCSAVKLKHEQDKRDYSQAIAEWRQRKQTYEARQAFDNAAIDAQAARFQAGDIDAIYEYFDMVLTNSSYPEGMAKEFHLTYEEDVKLLEVDYLLPNPDHMPGVAEVRYVASSGSMIEKQLKAKEKKELYDNVLYQICLRTCHEVFEADTIETIAAVVFNGYVNYVDQGTGNEVRACIMSLHVTKREFTRVELLRVDPRQCFRSLKGVGSAALHGMVPIAPVIQLRRDDPRFVASVDVVEQIQAGTNLAAIGWEEFEHLIRQLFEKEFATGGAEVKVTRASRDAGVDAVILDPDPIRGGKIIVQAKRYTNTVDVSAVRDLYGAVHNEGANKGILVTTSNFGPDAYSFSKDKPLTLLNGSNLLHLLHKHGTTARIDLAEARELSVGLRR